VSRSENYHYGRTYARNLGGVVGQGGGGAWEQIEMQDVLDAGRYTLVEEDE